MSKESDGRSGIMTALVEEMDRIYDGLEVRMIQLFAYIGSREIRYKDVTIVGLNVDPSHSCLRVLGELRALESVYPQLAFGEDSDIETLRDLLGRYKKSGFSRISSPYHDDVIGEIAVGIRGLLAKIALSKGNLERLEDNLFSLKSQDTKTILEPLVVFKKDTSSVKTLASEMKDHIADTSIWRDYRNTWKKLNQQIRFLGLPHYGLSEEMMANINKRYPTSEKLNIVDMNVCRELMNEIIDSSDVYDSMIAT